MANKETPRYDGHCMHLDPTEAERRIAAGESHVIRMKVPSEGVCQVQDMLRGIVEIGWDRMDMQVLMKADGLPTYFANVVDDHLMGITHVLRRGVAAVSTKLIKLYEYFGWEQPQLCCRCAAKSGQEQAVQAQEPDLGDLLRTHGLPAAGDAQLSRPHGLVDAG